MNNEHDKKHIKSHILEAIKSGRVAMRPRWHFILKAGLLAAGGILAFLTLLYLVSFTIFALRRSGAWFIPIFGFRGWYVFLVSLPWMLILFSLIFVLLLEILVRRYSFAYRRPLLYSVFGILALALVGSFIADRAQLHGRFFRYAEEHSLPFADEFYRGFEFQRFQDVHRGEILEKTSSGFVVKNQRGEDLTVIIDSRTRLPLGADFAEGDIVVVFGPRDGNMVQALGIREIDPDVVDEPFYGRRQGRMRLHLPPPSF